MISHDFQNQLARRALLAELDLSPALAGQLEAYYRLLVHWNARVNLTALPLNPITDQAVDRLLIEPIAAAQYLATAAPVWFDLGSGGGSPAIPLKLARPAGQLTMIESKERKAAFLRESVRSLKMDDTRVEAIRIEALATDYGLAATADLVTVRAVRADRALFDAIGKLLRFRGQAFLFGAKRSGLTVPRGYEVVESHSAGSEPDRDQALLVLNWIGL
jgi:16S rRNA (guanine(527)-N(7))-methyltransferase RsmG